MSAMSADQYSARKRRLIKKDDSQVELTRGEDVEEVASRLSQSPKNGLNENDGAGSDDVDYINYGTHLPTTTAITEEEEPYSLKLHLFRNAQPRSESGIVWKVVGRVKRTLRNAWETRVKEDDDGDQVSFIKTTVRELLTYMGFVIVICVVTLGVDVNSSSMYAYTKVMKDLFVNAPKFNEYTRMENFWEYSDTHLLSALYPKNAECEDHGFVLAENKLLGTPRIRQVRIGNYSCTVAKQIRSQTQECFAPYSKSEEDKSSTFRGSEGDIWEYKTPEKLNGTDIRGLIAVYGGGGYVHTLGNCRTDAQQTLKHLKHNNWLDRGTRAVFIDFTVYNANVNLFCVITLLFEFPATGGLVPNSHFQTLKLLRYQNNADIIVLAFQVFLFFYALYYTVEEMIELRMHGVSYFLDVWNCFDILLVVMGYLTLAFLIYVNSEVKAVLKTDEKNFAKLSSWNDDFKQFDSVFVFLAMIKIFKYVSFNKSMTQLQATLSRCAKDIAGFAVLFFIVFLAYAQWGYLMFSTQLQEFSTFQYCIYTLFRIVLGDFNFAAMEGARRVMGPIYFITYMFFVFFVLINMFLAIINDTYAEVKEELSQEESEFDLRNYFKKGYSKMVNKLSFKREKIVDIQEALFTADSNQDNALDIDEFRAELTTRGYADEEIEAMFKKYDLDGDRVLNGDEVMEMHGYLEEQKAELNEEMERVHQFADDFEKLDSGTSSLHGCSDDGDSDDGSLDDDDEFAVLTRRVNRLEHSIGNILSKLGSVLSKLEAMDDVKNKRRQTMCRLLDSVVNQIDEGYDNRTTQMKDVVRNELERWSH